MRKQLLSTWPATADAVSAADQRAGLCHAQEDKADLHCRQGRAGRGRAGRGGAAGFRASPSQENKQNKGVGNAA